jgi:benzil reductase ((S)-benzoin forming)
MDNTLFSGTPKPPISMKIYITGTSKGLGRALAEGYLDRGHQVVGIGRRNVIEHPNYEFVRCDLNDLEAVKRIRFESDGMSCMLINNAGIIGSVKRVSDLDAGALQEVMDINAIAPMILCQQFLKDIPTAGSVTILNISSGAASRAIPGWAAYCASKAALDRFSDTLFMEEQEKERNVIIYSLAPGVIDSEMQETIRSSEKKDFSSLQTFKDLKEKNELETPEAVARKIMELLSLPFDGRVVRSLREVKTDN